MWFPAHTTALDPLRAELEALLPAAEFTDAPIQFIGSATADVVAPNTAFADYWYTNLRSTVRFDRAVGAAVAHGARIFVEMSAHPALLFAMGAVLDDLPDVPEGSTVLLGTGRRDEPITDQLATNVVAAALADPRLSLGRPRAGPGTAGLPVRAHAIRTPSGRTPEPLPPVPGLTVAVEHWEAMPAAAVTDTRRAAVLDTGGDRDGGRVVACRRRTPRGSAPGGPRPTPTCSSWWPPTSTATPPQAADELSRRIGEPDSSTTSTPSPRPAATSGW